MRRIQLLLVLAVVACFALPTAAREIPHRQSELQRAITKPPNVSDYVRPRLFRSAAVDTFVLGSFSFDSSGAPDPQGWVSVDATFQAPIFHADDFAGMSPPYLPLEGQQSAWAGIRDAVGEFCGYATLPGYGNSMSQILRSRNFVVFGDVLLSY